MYEIFSPKWKYSKLILYFSILLTFSIIAFYNLKTGFVMSTDSNQFSSWADNLIKLNFNIFKYYEQIKFIAGSYFYTTFIVLISLTKVIFGFQWQNALFTLNLISLLLSLIIFSKCLLIIGVRPLIISFSMPLLIISVDLLTWPKFILTDMIFSFLVMLAIFIVIRGVIEKKILYLSLALTLFIIFITRPTSIPIIFAILFFLLISKYEIYKIPRQVLFIILLIFLVAPLLFTILYYYIDINFADNDKVIWLFAKIKNGVVILNRPETWVQPPETFFEFVHLYFVRLLQFFTPYAEGFSIIHNILNLIQFVAVFFSVIIWVLIGGKFKFLDSCFLMILIFSLIVALFHAFTQIDYDWRYRFPIIMPLIMLFPISLEMIMRKIKF